MTPSTIQKKIKAAIARWSGPTQSFLKWWLAELKVCIPPQVAHTLSVDEPRARVIVAKDGYRTEVVGAESVEVAAPEIQLKTSPEPFQDAVVVISDDLLLIKELVLPIQARDELAQIATYQARQHFPLVSEQLSLGYGLSVEDSNSNFTRLKLAVARIGIVEEHLTNIRRIGFEPVEVVSSGSNIQLAVPSVESHNQRRRFLSLAFIGLIVVQCALIPMIDINRVQLANTKLQGQLSVLLEKTKSASDLKKVIDRRFSEAEFLQAQSAGDVFAQTLRLLTAESPDDVWLTDLQYDGKTFRLSGFGRDAASWVLKLQERDLFQTVRLDNVAAGAGAGENGRFQIRLEIKPSNAGRKP